MTAHEYLFDLCTQAWQPAVDLNFEADVATPKLIVPILLAIAPYATILPTSLTLVLLSPRDVPLYSDGVVQNGLLAAGILIAAPLAFSSVRPLARLVENVFELLNR